MRVILYDDESFEPISVIELPKRAFNLMKTGMVYRFPVPQSVPSRPLRYADASEIANVERYTVSVELEPWHRKGQVGWVAVTKDAESALLLRSAFLPGQTGTVQSIARAEFVRGFMRCLDGLG